MKNILLLLSKIQIITIIIFIILSYCNTFSIATTIICSINMEDSFYINDAIYVDILVKNISSEKVTFPDLIASVGLSFKVSYSKYSTEINPRNPIGGLTPEVTLKPGESWNSKYYITLCYSFPNPGKYKINIHYPFTYYTIYDISYIDCTFEKEIEVLPYNKDIYKNIKEAYESKKWSDFLQLLSYNDENVIPFLMNKYKYSPSHVINALKRINTVDSEIAIIKLIENEVQMNNELKRLIKKNATFKNDILNNKDLISCDNPIVQKLLFELRKLCNE